MTFRVRKLDHNSSDLDSYTKAELKGMIENAGYSAPNVAKKEVYVDIATDIVAKLNAKKEKDDAYKAQQRENLLRQERESEVVLHAIAGTGEQIGKVAADRLSRLIAYQQKIAGNLGEMCYQLRHVEDVFFDSEYYYKTLRPLQRYFEKLKTEHKYTVEEIESHLKDSLNEGKRRLLRDGYCHCSTSAIANIQAMQEFKAQQHKVALYEAVIDCFDRMLKGEKVNSYLQVHIW